MASRRAPPRRNIFALVLLPDPGRDGVMGFVEWCRFVAGRLVFVGEIYLCVWAAGGFLAPWFRETFDFALGGWILGGFIGAICPFMVGFGFTLAQGALGLDRIRALSFVWFCLIVGFFLQALLGSELIATDRAAYLTAENADRRINERADAMADETEADASLEVARTEVEIARADLEEAEALRAELATLPANTWHSRTGEIQTIIGAVPDGIKYDQTVRLMTEHVSRYETALTAALDERELAQGALAEIRARKVGGEVDELRDSATNTEEADSRIGGFRQLALLTFRIAHDPRQADSNAVEARSYTLMEVLAYGLAIFLTYANVSLNTHAPRDDEDEEDDIGEPSPPLLPAPTRTARAVDALPWPPGDVPISAAAQRLAAARARRGAPVTSPLVDRAPSDDDLDLREAKALEALDRKERIAAIERMEAEARSAPPQAVAGVAEQSDDVRDSIAAINARRLVDLRADLRGLTIEINTALSPRARADVEARMQAVRDEIASITSEQLKLNRA